MWYFTWCLGLGLAVTFGILNGLWLEHSHAAEDEAVPAPIPRRVRAPR